MIITNQIDAIKEALVKPSHAGFLATLEIQHTLSELTNILAKSDASDFAKQIESFLAKRWERIRGTDLTYVHASHLEITALCLALANQIAPAAGKGALQLLMPTIKNTKNPVTLMSLDEYSLQEILLSDDDTDFFDIATTLENPKQFQLSENEAHRLIHHSTETLSFHDAINELHQFDKDGSMGGAIESCLMTRLKHSGVNGKRDGGESHAGSDSAIGLVNFQAYLNTLSRQEKRILFSSRVTPTENIFFSQLWDRLTHRKQSTDTSPAREVTSTHTKLDSIYCVEIIALELHLLLQNNPHLYHKKSLNKTSYIEKLQENQKTAQANLLSKLNQSPAKIAASYGDKGKAQLASHILNDAIFASLSTQDQNSLKAHLQSLEAAVLSMQIEQTPAGNRFTFMKIAGLDYICQQFCKDGYQLARLLKLLPENDRYLFIQSCPKSTLQNLIEDKFQLAEVITMLSATAANDLLQSLDAAYLQKIFKTSYELRLFFAKKLDLVDWNKAGVLLQSKVLTQQVKLLLCQDLKMIPAEMRFQLVLLTGIKRALSFIEDGKALKIFLANFTKEEQKQILAEVNFKQIFLMNSANSKAELKMKIATALNQADDFCLFPEAHQRLVKDTLTYYSEERTKKAPPLSFFSSKTKALKTLNDVVSNNAPASKLAQHKKQFEKNNTLGNIYRSIKI